MAVAAPASGTTPTDAEVVTGIAKVYLGNRAIRVTSVYLPPKTDPLNVISVESTTDAFAARVRSETPLLDADRAEFSGTAAEYSHARVVLENVEVTVGETTAELRVTEATDLYLAAKNADPGNEDIPESTSYRLDHTFRFERIAGKWKMASDVVDLPAAVPAPTPYATAERTGFVDPDVPTEENPMADPAEANTPDAPPVPREGEQVTMAEASGAAAFNRLAAIGYAVKWAYGRNPAYNSYGNDCTNFLSQIMRAGGWPNYGVGEGPVKWWRIPPKDSRTWSIADEFYWFAKLSNRMRPYRGEPVRPGDAVFADWAGGHADRRIDHAMFVTKVSRPYDWNGIYVTYHTSNQLNKPMARVVADTKALWKNSFGGVYYFMDTR
ncbi:amidase domain-containing protein [Actinokineospora sp. HUAS TT18]|uniref:amidase domain-containing protein n=1 Tax=Actinokineospora sp. HUAS TT18 TaxID=3447451 RepID=UPI003F51FCB4